MKGIRRSLNKDKISNPTPTYSSLPTAGLPSTAAAQKQRTNHGSNAPAGPSSVLSRPSQAGTAAQTPPKRVIRATESYKARSSQELSFEKGDFFHVVSDEGGDEWFDASNPMTGARGMVPAEFFQVLGRNVRETQQQQQTLARKGSATSSSNGASAAYHHPSASTSGVRRTSNASHQQQQAYGTGQASAYSSTASPPPSHSANGQARVNGRPTSQSASKPQPLYGVVQYDFVAERADELDAKRGEPIIVIAQSNHEWFVAKPIGRLGGPGLIPVAFVEIQDMTTGKPVENVEELIRSAVVPKVEEWKKMTAEYKSASIPLGRFDFAGGNGSINSPHGQALSTGSAIRSPTEDHTSGYTSKSLGTPVTTSQIDSEQYDNDEHDSRRYSYTHERRKYGLVTAASVESFHHEEDSYWFHLRAFFSTGASLVLYRLYQDFYDFQIALMDEFPVEAGRIPPGGEDSGRQPERILPMMPGPTDYEDEVVCAQRVHDLSLYLNDLCALPEHIRSSGLMYEFLVPRAGDVEVAPGNERGDEPGWGADTSIDGQYGEVVEYLDQMNPGQQRASGATRGVADDMARLDINGGQEEYDSRQAYDRRSQQSQPARAESRQSQSSATVSQQQQAPMGNANQNVPFIKIKIFHRNTDDLIAIRVPPHVSHAALLDKVRERLGSDVVNLRYREEVGSSTPSGAHVVMAGGARLVGIETDLDLERWIRSGARLVLYAD
ncbi:bud emergence protein 1 [Microbotryomycetes sp. JL201]|nr:bud emergence protein 1 [Microbotryomycetes sp. JL201]